MNEISLADAEYIARKWKTRRKRFLEQMDTLTTGRGRGNSRVLPSLARTEGEGCIPTGRVWKGCFLTMIFAFLTGCAGPVLISDYRKQVGFDYPSLNVAVEKGLGESLVHKGIRTEIESIEISKLTVFNKKEGESSMLTCGMAVRPGTYFKVGNYQINNDNTDCYGPTQFTLSRSDGKASIMCPGSMHAGTICIHENGAIYLKRIGFMSSVFPTVRLRQGKDNIHKVKKVLETPSFFLQELLYNGRVNNQLKFTYREFAQDKIRPAFTQEVQYDLSESNTIGFRSLRIEVLDATNTKIRYKILSNF